MDEPIVGWGFEYHPTWMEYLNDGSMATREVIMIGPEDEMAEILEAFRVR